MAEDEEEEMLTLCQEPVNAESRGLTDISTMKRQLELARIFPGLKLEIKDVTDDPSIPLAFKGGLVANPGSTLIFMENFLAPGRMYKIVASKSPGGATAEFWDAVRNINDPIAANRTFTTNVGTSIRKRWQTLTMNFWTTAARAVPSIVARNIGVYVRRRDMATGQTWRWPVRILLANVAGTVVICGDPESCTQIGFMDEWEIEYSQPIANVFVDTHWELEVK